MQRNERARLANIGTLAAKKLGFLRATYLDAGENGIALLVDDNVIMKVTTDATEYVEASKIKGKKTKHLADIYGIWVIKNPEYDGTYIITKEMVDVGYASRNKLEHAHQSLDDIWASSDIDVETNEESSIAFFQSYWSYQNSAMVDKAKQFLAPLSKEALWYVDQMVGMMDEMKRYGINSQDHYGNINIGLKGDNIVYYDMGYGQPMHMDMNYLELEGKLRSEVRSVLLDLTRGSIA